jgi:hypothetical protein
VVACVAFSGVAAVGAALLPDTPRNVFASAPHLRIVARGQVRYVAEAVERWSEQHGGGCPSSLQELRAEGFLTEGFLIAPPLDPWGEPLLFGCVPRPRAYVVLSKGADHTAGTDDDLFAP